MPSSTYDTIPLVLQIVTQEIKPKSILDIGIGTGKYGMLFWEYLDVWNTSKPYKEKVVKLYGVEAFKDYANQGWIAYDKIWYQDVFKVLDELPEVDLLFLGDVIEHFTKENGKLLLEKLKYKDALIVTPIKVLEQGAVYGNEFEKHISVWNYEDFENIFSAYEINNAKVIWLKNA